MKEDPPTGRKFFEDSLTPGNEVEAALRPPAFEDFTGQPKTIERLQVMVGAASKREEALKHVLLCGPPGLGKTTLAHIIGHELQRRFESLPGQLLTSLGTLPDY